MKKSTIFCALIASIVGAQLILAHVGRAEPMSAPAEIDYIEESAPLSGMFFSTEYVVEEYEYDEAYCIVYDDPDANMVETEICVDLETYQMVISAIRDGEHVVGTLVLNDDYTTDEFKVFTFMPELEYEQAAASANQ